MLTGMWDIMGYIFIYMCIYVLMIFMGLHGM